MYWIIFRIIVIERLGDLGAIVIDDGIDALADLVTGLDQRLSQFVDVFLRAGMPAFEIDEENVALRIILHALMHVKIEQLGEQAHRLVDEEALVHQFGLFDDGLEGHMREHVLLDVDARRDFNQLQPLLARNGTRSVR